MYESDIDVSVTLNAKGIGTFKINISSLEPREERLSFRSSINPVRILLVPKKDKVYPHLRGKVTEKSFSIAEVKDRSRIYHNPSRYLKVEEISACGFCNSCPKYSIN